MTRRERLQATIAHIRATFPPREAKRFAAAFEARLARLEK